MLFLSLCKDPSLSKQTYFRSIPLFHDIRPIFIVWRIDSTALQTPSKVGNQHLSDLSSFETTHWQISFSMWRQRLVLRSMSHARLEGREQFEVIGGRLCQSWQGTSTVQCLYSSWRCCPQKLGSSIAGLAAATVEVEVNCSIYGKISAITKTLKR